MSINMLLKPVVFLAMLTCLNSMADDANIIQQLNRRYEAAKTEVERRSVCLEAIDKGVIRRDGPVANVKAVFGSDFWEDIGKDSDGISYGIVHFIKPRKTGPGDPGLVTGWYLTVYYAGGVVYKYDLTNLHK